MITFKINGQNYKVEKRPLKTNSNYNQSITVYRGKEFIAGWQEMETVKDIDLLQHAINTIKNPSTLEL